MSAGVGVELCSPMVGVADADVCRLSPYDGNMALILFCWAVCKKWVREVAPDRVLRDRRIILLT